MFGGVFLLLRAFALFGFGLVAFEGERFGHVGLWLEINVKL
jgi:hypothetical protein